MNQSRLLSKMEMTHSRLVEQQATEEQKQLSKQQQEEQINMTQTLCQNARKSYVAHKSKHSKKEEIKGEDFLAPKKQKMNHLSSEKLEADPRVSKLPNYNILQVQQLSSHSHTSSSSHQEGSKDQKSTSSSSMGCFFCMGGTSDPSEYQAVVQEPCKFMLFEKGSYTNLVYGFNFDTVLVDVEADFKRAENQFLLRCGGLTLRISHKSSLIIKEWYEHLRRLIADSFGKELQMTDILEHHKHNFHKIFFASEDEFAQNCQTGDIILFEDEHFFARAQRFITNSDYDHVAMVIRDKTFGILMFEANSMSGVTLTPWNCMIKYGWYKYISRIVWRKLQNVERSAFFQKVIHKFVKENLKVNYYISVDKLLSNKSYVGKKDEPKGFFCSELIATVYKDLEIMTRNQQSKNYLPAIKVYPYHFSQKYDLGLEAGNLSEENEIVFNEKLLVKTYGEDFIKKK